jgi:hypothetical protein
MKPPPIDSAPEIEAIAKILLKDCKAFGVFPTPVDRIVRAAQLKIDQGVDLSVAKQGFFSKAFEGIGKVPHKVLGLLDFREKIIYLDLTQDPSRKRFIELHEVGHDVLPWQGEAYRLDDEKTLDPFVKETFEQEASYFASSALFQLGRFGDEAEKLPLTIGSPMALAKKFGSSCQAAIRRFVQYSDKRCAVLVMNLPDDKMRCNVRNYFESASFAAEFPCLQWPEACDASFPFVCDMLQKRKYHETGTIVLSTSVDGPVALNYHFFNNGFNGFVFLFPPGEVRRSRTKIVVAR